MMKCLSHLRLFNRYRLVMWIAAGVIVFSIALPLLSIFVFPRVLLVDFAVTFYPAGNHLLRGENIYFNDYPNPNDLKQYPPYSPIWVVFHALPLAGLPLQWAAALRFLLDVALLPLMALLSGKWAGLQDKRKIVLLALAPWFVMLVLAGQVSILIFVGILLSYYGIRRADSWMVGIGLVFLLLKPHIVALLVVAVLLFAWRNRILFRSLGLSLVLMFIGSLTQPLWIFDIVHLWAERLRHPIELDSVRLLPGYPYSQLGLLIVGSIVLVLHFVRSPGKGPSKWLWSVLVTVSLLGGLHTMPYDWINLMLPLAILIWQRWGVVLTIMLYLYPLFYALMLLTVDIQLIPFTIIPSIVLVALFGSRLWEKTTGVENLSVSLAE